MQPETEQDQPHWLVGAATHASSNPTPTTTRRARLPPPPRREIADDVEPLTPSLRIRGWEPAVSPSAAQATTSHRSVTGYFDTQKRYRDGGNRGGDDGSSMVPASDRGEFPINGKAFASRTMRD